MSKMSSYAGVGKRKSSIARVFISPSKKSAFDINGRSLEDYFMGRGLYMDAVKSALKITNSEDKFHIKVNVKGGGVSGQADSIKFGIAKALVSFSDENRGILKEEGLLTRDTRRVERKKYGKKKSRKSPQFSKR